MNSDFKKEYSNDDLSIKILMNSQESADYPVQNQGFEKKAYKSSNLAGINTNMADLGLVNIKNNTPELKLKGLGKPERSDLVTEVLETPPNWLIRWGSTWTLLVLAMILAISWFAQYPDLLKGKMQITSNDLAKTVTARKEGLLDELLVKDGQKVVKNQILGRIHSLADPTQIAKLKQTMLAIQKSKNEMGNVPQYDGLGEIQPYFQTFYNTYILAESYGVSGVEAQRMGILNNDISELRDIDSKIQQQLSNYQKDYNLAREEYQNQQKLFGKKLISQNELRASESKMISKKSQYDQLVTSLNNNQLQINQKNQEILNLKKSDKEYQNKLELEVGTLLQHIQDWEEMHFIKAVADGKVLFIKNIQENQMLKAGENLLYVMPEKGNWYGEMYVGQYNIGKIKPGQRVILKFDGYPYQEFGTIDGKVAYVSEIPLDSVYLLKIALPDQKAMAKNNKIKIKVGMTAGAEVVTEELRLIEKLFYEIRKYIKG